MRIILILVGGNQFASFPYCGEKLFVGATIVDKDVSSDSSGQSFTIAYLDIEKSNINLIVNKRY